MSSLKHSSRVIQSATAVSARIALLVDELARDYAELSVSMVVIAEGARRFAAALERGMHARGVVPRLLFVRARRTRGGTRLGQVALEDVALDQLRGRHVLIVDDIADQGLTLQAVSQRVMEVDPLSVRLAVLVNKLERRQVQLELDYVGFELREGWVVGFGMDLDGEYRDLDQLALVEP